LASGNNLSEIPPTAGIDANLAIVGGGRAQSWLSVLPFQSRFGHSRVVGYGCSPLEDGAPHERESEGNEASGGRLGRALFSSGSDAHDALRRRSGALSTVRPSGFIPLSRRVGAQHSRESRKGSSPRIVGHKLPSLRCLPPRWFSGGVLFCARGRCTGRGRALVSPF
jgi:hypothetical protein